MYTDALHAKGKENIKKNHMPSLNASLCKKHKECPPGGRFMEIYYSPIW